MSGSVGAYIGVLDAILLNGYNSKTITITRSGSTATATASSHGFVAGQVILVAGANESDYNGEFAIVSVPTTSTFTYTVANSPATPATGSITAKIAPAGGWAKAYSGTNLAAYRAAAGNRFYYRVDDTGTTTSRVVGYESMTDINTGTDAFPTSAQFSGGLYVAKSGNADANSRKWIAVATDRVFYIANDQANNAYNAEQSDVYAFGEFDSRVTSDAYKTFIIARNTSSLSGGTGMWYFHITNTVNTTHVGHYLARNYNGSTKSVAFGKRLHPVLTNINTSPSIPISTFKFPSWPDRRTFLSRSQIFEISTAGIYRGDLDGIWSLGQNITTTDFRTFDFFTPGSGSTLYGKRFLCMRGAGGGIIFFEVSDTWSVT
jgi:hypothetical protein